MKVMLYRVFQAQWKYPVKDDWTTTVKQELIDLKINLSLEEIKEKTVWSFKRLVKMKTKDYKLEYLLNLKQKHSKMSNLQYEELRLQSYLMDENITVKEAKNVFKYRTRVANFKDNFKNNHDGGMECPLCLEQPDSQAHSVLCPVIKANIDVRGDYSEIFTHEISKEISQTLLNITLFRESMRQSPNGGPSASNDAANICANLHMFDIG